MASYICIRNAVPYRSLYVELSSEPIKYDELNNCGTYESFIDLIRSVSKEAIPAISSITHNQRSLNAIRTCLDDDNVKDLLFILNSMNNKQRVPLLNIIHELSNLELKLFFNDNENKFPNTLKDIHSKYAITPQTTLDIINKAYPLLKDYLK